MFHLGNLGWLILAALTIVWTRAGVDLILAGEPAAGAMTFAYLGSLGCIAFLTYRKGKRKAWANAQAYAEARAQAEAKAQSTAHAQQAVVVNVDTSGGARAVAARELGGLDRVSWRGDPVPLIEQDSVDDVSEELLAEIRETTIESA